MGYDIGRLVISKSGHDKGDIYMIMSEDKEYVFVSEGNRRPIEKLKKKNKKHIQLTGHYYEDIANKIRKNKIKNEDIKRTIKLFEQNKNI